MRRIAILIPDFYEGGMPRAASNLIRFLQNKYAVDLILCEANAEVRYPVYTSNIIELYPLGKNKFLKMITFLKRINKVRKIKHRNKYSAVISYGVGSNIINILSGGRRRIITEHNVKSIENRNWGFFGVVYDILIKKYYSRADLIVTVSEGVKQDLIENYGISGDKIQTILNSHSIDKIKSMSKEELTDSEKEMFKAHTVFITVGRLTEIKNHISQIKIFKQLTKVYPNVRLLILGEGEKEVFLKNKVKEYKLEKNILFLGFSDNPFKYIKNSDCFILSSLNEGYPNVLVESLICGTPILTSDCKSGPREILESEDLNYNNMLNSYLVFASGILTKRMETPGHYSEKLNESEQDMLFALLFFINNKERYKTFEFTSVEKYTIEEVGLKFIKLIN